MIRLIRNGCENMARKKMSKEEKIAWEQLYNYVKSNVMKYDENQALSKNMILRLKGLLTGKFIENKNIENTANYSYEVILATFKYCSPDIQKALRSNQFKDEQHKFNYVLKIVDKNINDMYMRMNNVKKAKEEAKNTSVKAVNHISAEYKPKEKKKDKFSDLW